MLTLLIIIFVILAGSIIGLYFLLKHKKSKANNTSSNSTNSKLDENEQKQSGNTISPQKFDIGMIKEPRHKNANVCSNTQGPVYSIQQPYVEYGNEKQISANCKCVEFIASP